MAGGQYIALSGMRARLDELDRLAADLANASTSGYKGERIGHENVPRPSFAAALETAIDVSMGRRRLDVRAGAIQETGRALDIAIEGPGFLTVQTPAGLRYTRNGQFTRNADGSLTTADGAVVIGVDGPIKVGTGPVTFESDGSVLSGGAVAGRLALVEFGSPGDLQREGGAVLDPNGATPRPATTSAVRAGALEQSNVSVVDRVAALTNVSRSFQALQRAVSVLMNDIDGRTIEQIGRR